MVEVKQICRNSNCIFARTWRSQPVVGNIAAGNLLLSGAILTAGCCPKKFIRALKNINCATISYSTFFNHQAWYYQPAIADTWLTSQKQLVLSSRQQEGGVFLGTDMRADSMGHSAKYGCYSTLDVRENKVLHIELVQKNECGNKSNCMEKEGLIRTVRWLDNQDITVGSIVTDRHRSIAKYIREELSPNGVTHYYDVWHVAKGLKKKLLKVSKMSGCDIVSGWIHGITNNIYWIAASTPDGDKEVMLAKFDSVMNHIYNIHTHDNPLFPSCAHGPLEPRNWLTSGTKPAQQVAKILEAKTLRKDIQMLSPKMQTSCVESFHSVITQFAPKMYAYSFGAMLCRIFLAVLHYNENAGRAQARDTEGNLRHVLVYPRSKQDSGGYTVRRVLVDSTHIYAEQILNKAVVLCMRGDKTTRKEYLQLHCDPGTMTSTMSQTRPKKEEAVQQFVSRFKAQTNPVGRPLQADINKGVKRKKHKKDTDKNKGKK